MTFASEVLCRVVTLLQCLPLVCSGSAAHGIARKKDVTNMGLLRCRRGPQLRSVPGLQQEGICMAVGIARVILWDCTNLVQHLKDKHAQLHREFNKRLRCRMQRLCQVVQRLSGKYHFEPESGDCIRICRLSCIGDACTQCIHGRTGEMIALDCQPFSMAEDQGFRQ